MEGYNIIDKPEWGPLATFVPNKDLAIHNWFYYKEGFAKELVMRLADMFSLKKGMCVLDPFMGSGTTLLACKELGISSVGFDVHPVAVFAAKVKSRDYDTHEIEEAIKSLIRHGQAEAKMPRSKLLERFFPPRTLKETLVYTSRILGNKDISSHVRDFLMLGLMNVAIKCSFAYKDGSVIKVRKKPVPPVKDMLRRQLYHMLRDLSASNPSKLLECEAMAEFGDARFLPLEPGSVDAVITSPPYLNKIEYTRIYEIEHELFLRHVQELPAARSYIGLSLNKLERDISGLEKALDYETVQSLPPEAIPYMMDMFQSIKEMHRVCRAGAKIGLVVGNGCFPTGVVDSDTLLSRMAESLGFSVDKILVLNKRWCTRNRVEKVGVTRESLLLWDK